MSSYFDTKTHAVNEASDKATDDKEFIRQVCEIERQLIRDVTLAAGDREFPADLREKAMALIARWHVGTFAGLPPTDEALKYALLTKMSELVDTMHSLFHDVARRRVQTRFGQLSDHPADIVNRRDEHDSEKNVAGLCDSEGRYNY